MARQEAHRTRRASWRSGTHAPTPAAQGWATTAKMGAEQLRQSSVHVTDA